MQLLINSKKIRDLQKHYKTLQQALLLNYKKTISITNVGVPHVE
jgi:hypothetical protein